MNLLFASGVIAFLSCCSSWTLDTQKSTAGEATCPLPLPISMEIYQAELYYFAFVTGRYHKNDKIIVACSNRDFLLCLGSLSHSIGVLWVCSHVHMESALFHIVRIYMTGRARDFPLMAMTEARGSRKQMSWHIHLT